MITFTDKFRPYNAYYNGGLITNYVPPTWLDGWARRQPITLTGAASGAQTDYQIQLTVPFNGNMDSDFRDLRFTDSNHNLIDYWRIMYLSDTTAYIWVEFPTTPANTATETYYMYYDNNAAPDASDAANTMLQYHGNATSSFLDPMLVPYDNVAYGALVVPQSTPHSLRWGLSNHIDGTDDMMMINSRTAANRRTFYTRESGAISETYESPSFTFNDEYNLTITRTEGVCKAYVDDNVIGTQLTTNLPNEPMGLWMNPLTGIQLQYYSYARKFVNNPATYQFGAEETQ